MKDSVNKFTRISTDITETDEPLIEPVIKKPEKPKDKGEKKHVTFADQVLDDTIGTEPLSAKPSDRKCTKGNLKKSSAVVKKNESFKNHSIPLIWLFFSTFISLTLVVG